MMLFAATFSELVMSSRRSRGVSRSVLFYYPTLLVIMVGCQECVSTTIDSSAPPEVMEQNGTMYAACKMKPSTTLVQGLPKVYGQVLFKQEYPQGTLKVLLHLSGLPVESSTEARAVHIHQYGDFSQGCESTGGHYNPHKVPHPGHPGDFGNFFPVQGRIHKVIDSSASLFGALSALGRSVVIHERLDDMGHGGDAGSLLHGNAGRRLACCAIGISSPRLWNMFYDRQQRRAARHRGN